MINAFTKEYRFLSNFWPVYVKYEGIEYPSVEHGYQAAKSADGQYRFYILQAKTAKEAKALGKICNLRPDWEQVRLSIMESLLKQKFHVLYLHAKLLATSDEYLEEGNLWHDTFWGCCYCRKHQGEGLNWLGRLLMSIRENKNDRI